MRHRAHKEHTRPEAHIQKLSMQLEYEKERYLEKLEPVEESRQQLEQSFSALSQ